MLKEEDEDRDTETHRKKQHGVGILYAVAYKEMLKQRMKIDKVYNFYKKKIIFKQC